MSLAFRAVLASLCFFIRSLTCLQHRIGDSLVSAKIHLPLHRGHLPRQPPLSLQGPCNSVFVAWLDSRHPAPMLAMSDD